MKKIDLVLKISSIIFLLMLGLSSIYYFVWSPYVKEINFSKCLESISDQALGKNQSITYEDVIKFKNLCSSGYWEANLSSISRKADDQANKCNFAISGIKINRYDFNGPNIDKMKSLEERCRTSINSGGYRSLACTWLEDEKKSDRKDTYYEIEGLLKNNSEPEYLRSVVSKIYTNDNNKILLSTGFIDIKRMIETGESVPFKISAYIDRNQEFIKNYFNGDKINVDTYPWFSTCE